MKQLGRYSKEPLEEVHFGIKYLLNFIYHTTKFHNCVCANQGWWKQLCNILFFESKVTTYFNRDLLTPFHYGDIPALAKTNFGGWHCDYDMNNKPYKWIKKVLSIIHIWLFLFQWKEHQNQIWGGTCKQSPVKKLWNNQNQISRGTCQQFTSRLQSKQLSSKR